MPPLTKKQIEHVADQNERNAGPGNSGYQNGMTREDWIWSAMIGNGLDPDAPDTPAPAAPAAGPAAAPEQSSTPAMQALMQPPPDPGAGWATVGGSSLNPNLGKGQPPLRPALRALSNAGQLY